jgi:hypothetical protein
MVAARGGRSGVFELSFVDDQCEPEHGWGASQQAAAKADWVGGDLGEIEYRGGVSKDWAPDGDGCEADRDQEFGEGGHSDETVGLAEPAEPVRMY